jgi:hypothetical protein
MFAISAAVGEPLQSFCPPGSWSMPHPYTKRVVGRDVVDLPQHEPRIVIMWTEAVAPERAADLHPNHFVCLIRSTSHTHFASHNCDAENDDHSCGSRHRSFTCDYEDDCAANACDTPGGENDVRSCDGVSANEDFDEWVSSDSDEIYWNDDSRTIRRNWSFNLFLLLYCVGATYDSTRITAVAVTCFNNYNCSR